MINYLPMDRKRQKRRPLGNFDFSNHIQQVVEEVRVKGFIPEVLPYTESSPTSSQDSAVASSQIEKTQ